MYFTNKNKTSKIAQHFHDNLYYNISRVNFILAEKTADRKRNSPPPAGELTTQLCLHTVVMVVAS